MVLTSFGSFHMPHRAAWKCAVVGLILGQVLLLSYLLPLERMAVLVVGLVVAAAAATACCRLLDRDDGGRNRCMLVVMFSAGGFGMLLGSTVDLGGLGLYGLVALCQSLPLSAIQLEGFWQRMALTPWTYVGMLLGGNLGMLAFDLAKPPRHRLRTILGYGLCNLGMMAGMVAGEEILMGLNGWLTQGLVAALMFPAMLAGMILGMAMLTALVKPLLSVTHPGHSAEDCCL